MKLFLAALVLASVVLAAFGSPADEDHAKWQAFKVSCLSSYTNYITIDGSINITQC